LSYGPLQKSSLSLSQNAWFCQEVRKIKPKDSRVWGSI